MAYSLSFHPQRVTAHLRQYAGLSRASRIRLFASLTSELRHRGDVYRNNPSLRLAAESPYFWYDVLIPSDAGDGRMRRFSFVISDAAAVYGVLLVEFVHVVDA